MQNNNCNLVQEFLLDIAKQNSHFFKSIIDVIPYGLTLWNSDFNYVMCNNKSIELLGKGIKENNLNELAKTTSPQYQPNGKLSAELANEYISEAYKNGTKTFKWLHLSPSGVEFPAQITLTRIDPAKESDKPLLAGFTQDLRPFLVGNDDIDIMGDYFHDKVSYKSLFNSIIDMSEKLFFVYDVRTSQMQYYGNGAEKLGVTKRCQKFPDELLQCKKIHPDDEEKFIQSIIDARKGIEKPVELRFFDLQGISRYFRFTYKVITNNNSEPVNIIGKIEDINDKKQIEEKLKKDLLTDCYNKVATETAIKEIIAKESNNEYVFFIVDIDNFKSINDTLGHHFGDITLQDVSMNLQSCFRSDDIVGRIGGDEFVVFTKNISDKKTITERAEKIADILRNSYSAENKTHNISVSIGISKYPNDGKDFLTLYKAADKALYQSKRSGKDCYTCYSSNMSNGIVEQRTFLENSKRIEANNYDTELAANVFTLLFEANDIQSAINASLSLIGKKFNAIRSYIFQTFDNGETYKNTYEWCSDAVSPEINNLQHIPKHIFDEYFIKAINKNTTDLTKVIVQEMTLEQNVKSCILSRVKYTQELNIVFGIDDCNKNRTWTEKEMNTIQYLAKFLSTFLKFNRLEL